MEITLLLKVVGIGMLVAVSNQILSKTGRDELATWITVAGIVLVLIMLIGQIGGLFESIRTIFGV
jgi:stage III sporulation protein AC